MAKKQFVQQSPALGEAQPPPKKTNNASSLRFDGDGFKVTYTLNSERSKVMLDHIRALAPESKGAIVLRGRGRAKKQSR